MKYRLTVINVADEALLSCRGAVMIVPVCHILETNIRLRDHARVDDERPLITVITIMGNFLFQIIHKYLENNRYNK